MNRQSAVVLKSEYLDIGRGHTELRSIPRRRKSRLPRPEARAFFAAASDAELHVFFDRLYSLSSPEREDMFVAFCLSQACSGAKA